MADDTLSTLTGASAVICGVTVRPLKLRQLPRMLELCQPVLAHIVQHRADFDKDFEGSLIALAMENAGQWQEIIREAAGVSAEQVQDMEVDEMVTAVGHLISINKVFFSQLKLRLESMQKANQQD